MVILDAFAWAATIAVLVTYGLSARRPRRILWFHSANAIGCVPIGASAIAHHAYPQLALTASFGAVGAYAIIRRRAMRVPVRHLYPGTGAP